MMKSVLYSKVIKVENQLEKFDHFVQRDVLLTTLNTVKKQTIHV
jgi:hypothetical protein